MASVWFMGWVFVWSAVVEVLVLCVCFLFVSSGVVEVLVLLFCCCLCFLKCKIKRDRLERSCE